MFKPNIVCRARSKYCVSRQGPITACHGKIKILRVRKILRKVKLLRPGKVQTFYVAARSEKCMSWQVPIATCRGKVKFCVL